MTPEKKISAYIITYNEEKNIGEVLNCLDFADEIVVVDSFSNDRTVDIAKTFTKVKVIQNQFQDFTKQRNFAIDHLQHEWIIFLDADERITPALREEILKITQKPDAKEAYYFYRQFFFQGKPINYSGTQNDKNFRMFRNGKARFSSKKLVHETLEVDGEIGVLKNKLLHYSFDSYETYRQKMIHYGELKGKELFNKGKKYNILTQYAKTVFKFFKSYVMKLGFLDGKAGFDLCYLQTLSVYHTYTSLKNQEKRI